MKLPEKFTIEYNLTQLSNWFKDNRPDLETPSIIEMTYDQEYRYRYLLKPEFAVEKNLMYRGIPIIIYKI